VMQVMQGRGWDGWHGKSTTLLLSSLMWLRPTVPLSPNPSTPCYCWLAPCSTPLVGVLADTGRYGVRRGECLPKQRPCRWAGASWALAYLSSPNCSCTAPCVAPALLLSPLASPPLSSWGRGEGGRGAFGCLGGLLAEQCSGMITK